jgi:uncharacterized protein (DUF58 family)
VNIESQARWYATKVIFALFIIIAIFVIIGYNDLFWLFIVVMTMFALMIAGAIYHDAYYSKLVELQVKKYER